MKPKTPARPAAVALLFTVAGCSLAPGPKVPAVTADLPDEYSSIASADAVEAGASDEALQWWSAFDDPDLNRVIDSVLVANFDLAEAVARVEQARAQARIAKASYFPAVGASASASEQNTPANTGFGSQFGGLGGAPGDTTTAPTIDRFDFTTYSASIDFSYELDFWGRVRNDARAAGSDFMATTADLEAARIGVISTAIATYFEIVDLRARVTVATETVDVLGEREALAQTRYDRGLITSFELYQVRQDLRNTQAALPQLQTALADAEGRLSVLLGRYRSDLDALLPGTLAPSLPTTGVASGVPVDLLNQRPDVRAAAERLDAARFRWGARRAELLPSLSFSGSIGLQNSDPDGLFDADQWFRNLVANLTAPIFQGGRLKANVDAAEAQFEQAAAAFGRTVVTAVHEVEVALTQLSNEGRRYIFLTSQLEEADASLDLQASRYAAGVAGYTDYLDALRNRLNVESTLAGAGREYALARLAVHRAVGGAWTEADQAPVTEWVKGRAGTHNNPSGVNR